MNCPICQQSWGLYKELLPDGKVIICCLNGNCNYKSQPLDRHDAEKILPISELKKQWE